MSKSILIIGESGTGKSTSIRNLNPEETFIINVLDKPLPFRGYAKHYKKIDASAETGNYYSTSDYNKILTLINIVNQKRPDIKNLILDDYQYVICSEYMERATEVGYTKFTELARHTWDIFKALINARNDLYTIVLSHSEKDGNGFSKFKTIGRLLDEKITPEGMFTLTLHTAVVDGRYTFLTRNDGLHTVRASIDLFNEKFIDNDLQFVINQMEKYYNSDLEM